MVSYIEREIFQHVIIVAALYLVQAHLLDEALKELEVELVILVPAVVPVLLQVDDVMASGAVEQVFEPFLAVVVPQVFKVAEFDLLPFVADEYDRDIPKMEFALQAVFLFLIDLLLYLVKLLDPVEELLDRLDVREIEDKDDGFYFGIDFP